MIHYNFVDGNSVVGSNVPCIPSSPLKRLNQQLLTRHITMYKTVAYPGEKNNNGRGNRRNQWMGHSTGCHKPLKS